MLSSMVLAPVPSNLGCFMERGFLTFGCDLEEWCRVIAVLVVPDRRVGMEMKGQEPY
jgi:hypothetical protein